MRSGDHDPEAPFWTPTQVYAHLCKLFRRPKGELTLSQTEFTAAQAEYVRRQVPVRLGFGRPIPVLAQSEPPTPSQPRRHYHRLRREGILDATPTRLLEIVLRLCREEFAWMILRGEYRKSRIRNKDARLQHLKDQYAHLPQVLRQTLEEDLRHSSPYTLACQAIGEEFGLTPESIPVLLSPSKRRLAGTPPWLTVLLFDTAQEPIQ